MSGAVGIPRNSEALADPIRVVLLVEDNPGDAELVIEYLGEAARFPVVVVSRLAGAFECVRDGLVECVLLDLGLPDAEGLEGLRILREADPTVPIVVLTGLNDAILGEEAVRLGAQDYLVKAQLSGPGLDRALRYAVERQRQHARLAYQALHDALTGLPNRVLFGDRIEQAVARTGREGGSIGVMFADIDRFKLVNDSLGHEAGDRLIIEVAQRIRRVVRPSDTVARIGGDEFVVLVEGFASQTQAIEIAERVRSSVAVPFQLDGTEVFPSVSLGVALAVDVTCSAERLLRDADLAMYEAKRQGGDRLELFDASRAL